MAMEGRQLSFRLYAIMYEKVDIDLFRKFEQKAV